MDYESGLATGLAINDKGGNYAYGGMPYGYAGGLGAFGGDWIGLIVLAALFGWGGFGGGFGGRQGAYATQADLAAGFNNSTVLSSLDDIILQTSQGFAGVQQTLCQGFSGVNATINTTANQLNQVICNLGYTLQGSFNDLSHQLADTACATQRAIDGVNYNMATMGCDIKTAIYNSTRDIVDSQKEGTQAILGFLTTEKIAALQAENATLKGQISNDKQTATIVSTLRDSNCPIPAYWRPDPNCCFNPFTYYGQQSNGCACGAF